jgi:hypothetical protein
VDAFDRNGDGPFRRESRKRPVAGQDRLTGPAGFGTIHDPEESRLPDRVRQIDTERYDEAGRHRRADHVAIEDPLEIRLRTSSPDS